MTDEEKRYLRVVVSGMVRDQRSNPVVLLKMEGGEEVLPIWIGHAEGVAIELQMKGRSFERPLTHDLLKTTVESLGATVLKVAVTELRDNTFIAKVYMQRENEVHVLDARPSDSIALALKMDAPIFVAEDVFASHKRAIQTDPLAQQSPDEELRRYLENLDPGDF
jgi:bifunctional DNase/RNase